MSGTPFKMKGSPFQRNFGIGSSPLKDNPHKTTPEHSAHENKKLTTEQLLAKAKRQREEQITRRMSKHGVTREQSITRQKEIEGMTREEKDAAGIM